MRVCVIGAGASGLAAIKCCLDEGLEVVCYERTGCISGLWHYTEQVEEGQACVMKSTIINATKETMCFSDFPIPKEMAIFMHHREVDKYFHLYADKFGLKDKIQFNTEVLSVRKAADFIQTGKWTIEIKKRSTASSRKEMFDGVLVCTGHHANKNMATFPGMDQFAGSVIHSHDYKHGAGYEDRRVVVVGIGNSGGDIAVELSRICSQVFLSTRSGALVMNRISTRGDPMSFVSARRYKFTLRRWFPGYFQKKRLNELNNRFDHQKYGLMPKRPGFQHPTVNDDLPNRIASGTIKVKPNIAEFTPTGVRFEDGSVEEVDHVILATGYVFGFPFLDKSVVNVVENRVRLYKFMFPPALERNTLAIIGCIQPLGAVMPASEQQSRLAARVFKGDVALPSQAAMEADIDAKLSAMARRYMKSQRHTIQVDFVDFMDQLAELNGNKPNIFKMFFTDPRLAFECYFGPCTPYQYRLEGPGAWSGAREAIMTQWDRTYYPLCGDPKPETKGISVVNRQRVMSGVIALSAGVLCYLIYAKKTYTLQNLIHKVPLFKVTMQS